MDGAFFGSLNYTLGDEDSMVEHVMLEPGAGEVLAIAGSGARVIPLLARAPERLTCVDISAAQLALTRFRLAAVAELEREDYLGLLGYRPMPVEQRMRIVRTLRSGAETGRIEALIACGEPLIYQGRFERMLRRLARLVGAITGERGRRLFDCDSLDEQRRYLIDGFPRRRWSLVIALLGNSAVLNALLYRGAFPAKNRAGSHAQIYRSLFDRLLNRIEARRSFFLQMIFLGQLRHAEGFPIECSPKVYEAARRAARTTRLDFFQGDIVRCAAGRRDIDFVSLSDVPSFLPDAKARNVLADMKDGLRQGATVAMRGHMRVVKPALAGFSVATDRFRDAIAVETTQLWQIDAYRRD